MSLQPLYRWALVWFGIAAIAFGAEPPARFIGTIAAISVESGTAEVKSAAGEAIMIRLTAGTIFQRVGPGEKNLKNAQAISAGDISPGDRVLVNLEPGTNDAARLVVMPAAEITKRNEADSESWTTRGVGGVVTAKVGNVLTLRSRPGQTVPVEVTVGAETKFRKYAPDSVKFADAQTSSLQDVQVGDQLRARGDKSADGLKVTATEVVFGSFVTKAGKITAVDVDANALTITELNTGKTLRILIAPGSQVKAMPHFGAMMGGQPPPAGGMPSGKPPGGGPPGGGAPDPARMIEMMPAATLASLKPGQSVVVSSTRGAKEDEFTAIVLLGNAEMLIRMASMGASASANGGQRQNAGNAMQSGAMNGGMTGGFEIPAMMP
jgi:hypothetical protein